MRLPSLNHHILGGGAPSASQLKLKWRPDAIINCFPIGWSVTFGGEGSRNSAFKTIKIFYLIIYFCELAFVVIIAVNR